jgi:hypothetical protein
MTAQNGHQIILRVGNTDKVVTVSGEKEFSHWANENRRLQLADPNWSHQNQ